MTIKKPRLIHNFKDVPMGEGVKKYSKLYRDIKHIYENVDESLADDTVMYEVYSIEEGENYAGNLHWGLTVMNPVLVSGECNMTRGHFHEDLRCNEYYYGASGEGLLMFLDEKGIWCEEVYEGSLHNISGATAHRLINTGKNQLKVIAAWSSTAGLDYERVEKAPFSKRVYRIEDDIEFK